jgi:hypothetical protein
VTIQCVEKRKKENEREKNLKLEGKVLSSEILYLIYHSVRKQNIYLPVKERACERVVE